ncbi:glycosyltransferase [Enterobacter huaxiensis]|uniref:glycosyltransferase n=1 Tax=Enterobacter huaxiensis TaxID=2494702 RepID=UPI002175A200|nr:glycosyltransferase [Enterobacter huaxiensis]MCS5449770.1 glycosyltransferase [Enterobacter huaxiensis]
MKEIVIAIPRFALSGGNLVSLNLALYLHNNGFKIYACSGFTKKTITEVQLLRHERGVLNSLLNILSFLNLSLYSLFCRNFIATHHLTSIFNWIKPSRFALVQDIESQFYPKKLRVIGNVLWHNYLKAKCLIYTNEFLAKKIGGHFEDSYGFAYIDNDIEKSNVTKDNDKFSTALLILRDGKYKGYEETISLFEHLNSVGIKTFLINQSRSDIISDYQSNIKSGLPRDLFLEFMNHTEYFICLSQWEGLGLPNLEAFSLGKKIVSAPIPSALILHKEYPDCISLDTTFENITNIISNEKLKNNAGKSNFLNEQNQNWLNYVLNFVSTELNNAR